MIAPDSAWESRRLTDLPREERSRLVWRTSIRIGTVVVLMFVAYAVAPLTDRLADMSLIRAVIAIAVTIAIVVWQLRAIHVARYPALRAIQGFALIIPLLLLGFAATYVRLSAADRDAFNEPLDHVGALYLSMTTMATVGFGDVVAATHVARISVMFQMVADVIILGVVTRLMVNVVRSSTGRSDEERAARTGDAGR